MVGFAAASSLPPLPLEPAARKPRGWSAGVAGGFVEPFRAADPEAAVSDADMEVDATGFRQTPLTASVMCLRTVAGSTSAAFAAPSRHKRSNASAIS